MLGNKYRTKDGSSNNDLLSIKNVIQEIAQTEIQNSGFPTYVAAIVQKVNEDGTVDVYLPPNQDNLITGVLNKCGELLFVGDSVELATKNGSLTNCWVAIKHGTIVQGQAEEVENLSGEVVMKVKNGRLSVTELQRDASLGSSFTIIADDINLDGYNIVLNGARGITITSPYFNVTNEGYITATGGTIGGWTMGDTRLYSGTGSNYVALDSGTDGIDYVIWAGNETPASATFSVTRDGQIKAASGVIAGYTINGAQLIGTNVGMSGLSGQGYAFWAGSNTASSAPFRVGHNGSLVSTSATITGSVTATSGTIGGCSISNGVLQVGNANITDLNASKINAGTLSADRIAASSITAGKLNISTLSAISSNLGTITGGSININSYFSVNSSGGTQLSTSGGGFLTTRTTTHPYVSALNVAYGSGGVQFYSGTTQDSAGSRLGYVSSSSGGQLNLYGSAGIDMGTGGAGSIYCYNRVALSTGSSNYCWADGGGTGEGKIKTTAGDSSSRNLKENFVDFTQEDYNQAYKFLKEMKLHEYDYKYQIYEDKHQYGFIIDELEELENCDKFFRFTEIYAKVQGDKLKPSLLDGEDFDKNDKDIIKYKEYNSDVLDKFMLTCMKAMQDKIDKQEEEIKELKETINNIIVS